MIQSNKENQIWVQINLKIDKDKYKEIVDYLEKEEIKKHKFYTDSIVNQFNNI